MCGRYSNQAEFSDIKLTFQATGDALLAYQPTFNICPSSSPGHEQLIVAGKERQLLPARFWLIPSWWDRPLKNLPSTFNARSEGIAERPMFRDAFENSRCLIPATGWREFVGQKKKRQPHHFYPQLDELKLFAFAGISAQWVSDTGERVRSFAIITAEPSEQARPIHDRMPLVLPRDLEEDWLSASEPLKVLSDATRRLQELKLVIFPSNPIANSSRYEGPLAVQPDPSALGSTAQSSATESASFAAEHPSQLALFGHDARPKN